MENDTFTPELLVPAGDFEKLRYAFAYGADAVYAGVPIFSLRARENDFTLTSLKEAVAHSHQLGKRIYLTMNIYAHNSKVRPFLDSFCELADLGPDGFIMSDNGLIAQALRLRPDAVIHLSTQANATNWTAVEFFRDIGVKRVILSRELSLREIAQIHEKVPDIELEAFVHGSICIAQSGRCLISNYLNHRDANQGTCTNSCRWEYALLREKESLLAVEEMQQPRPRYQPLENRYAVTEKKRPNEVFPIDEDEHGTYLMNSKDLCAIELLQELRDAGVCSFKVEGRTKSLYYVAVITRAYRRAIDDLMDGRPFDKNNLLEVLSVSSRTLMTGFYLKRPQHYGENFCDGDSLPLTHRFAGIVRGTQAETGLAVVETKNKVSCGDTLEWLYPEKTVHAPVERICSSDGTEVSEVSGGLNCCLPHPAPAADFCLLRSPL